jgi:hypothetical protein
MGKTCIITYKGKTYFYMDFSMLKNLEDISSAISESKQYIRKQPLKSVLALTNVEGLHFNTEIISLFTDFLKGNKPFMSASAIVGIGGLVQFALNGAMKITGREIKSFNSLENAKDWLVSNNHGQGK